MKTVIISISVVVAAYLGSVVQAADVSKTAATACTESQTYGSEGCCGHCGCRAACEKHCKIVCEMKEVKKTVWVVKCSEFCTVMPRCPLGGRCGECDGNGCDACRPVETCKSGNACEKRCDPCASLENRDYIPPKCGRVREKKTLEKKEVTCKIPTYKCVVVYCCSNCGQSQSQAAPAAPAAPSPAPARDKTTLTAPLPPVVGTSFVE